MDKKARPFVLVVTLNLVDEDALDEYVDAHDLCLQDAHVWDKVIAAVNSILPCNLQYDNVGLDVVEIVCEWDEEPSGLLKQTEGGGYVLPHEMKAEFQGAKGE